MRRRNGQRSSRASFVKRREAQKSLEAQSLERTGPPHSLPDVGHGVRRPWNTEARSRRHRQTGGVRSHPHNVDLWEWQEEGRRRPKQPLDVYLQAVMKHVQELESGRKAIPIFELAGLLLDDAVEAAIAYLEK